ncbi:MAG: DUF4149 domain-containing protein [Thermodesulfobacteriota bacterium]
MRIPTLLYRLAVACWFGGASLFTFVLTPVIFRAYDRDLAGAVVGTLFPGYFRWGLVCGLIALACLVFAALPHRRIAALVLALMLAITASQAFIIEPRAAAIKREIPSFVTTPQDDPLRARFRRLHAVSAAGNLAVIGGGLVLIVLGSEMKRRKKE